MKDIVVGVDGSAPSVAAAKMAAQLARAQKARIVLVYVVPPFVAASELLVYPQALLDRLESEGKGQLERIAQIIEWPQTERLLIHGLPAEMLVAVADERDAALVVVGSRGRGAVARMLLGSVADRVVHTAGRPVLVVR